MNTTIRIAGFLAALALGACSGMPSGNEAENAAAQMDAPGTSIRFMVYAPCPGHTQCIAVDDATLELAKIDAPPEPVPGKFYTATPITAQATNEGNGSYRFDGIGDGTYSVIASKLELRAFADVDVPAKSSNPVELFLQCKTMPNGAIQSDVCP
jgi:hypothetical protein